jgi:pyruvate kinase
MLHLIYNALILSIKTRKMKRSLIIIFATTLAVVSCKTQEKATIQTQMDKDSTRIVRSETYRDTTALASIKKEAKANVIIAPQTVGVTNSDTSKLKTDHAISWAWVADGKLNHTIKTVNETFPVLLSKAIKESKTDVYRFRDRKITLKIFITKETNYLTKLQRFFIALGYCFAGVILAGIVYLGYRLKRRFIPTF